MLPTPQEVVVRFLEESVTIRREAGGFVVVPKVPNGYVLFFRGGTRRFGELTFAYVMRVIAPLAASLNVIVACPEYGADDQHGGETDLSECDRFLASFVREYPTLEFCGTWGTSRGCVQAWRFLLRHAELQGRPLALWCPVYDMEAWLRERPDVAGLFQNIGISSSEDRSAKLHLREISGTASRFLILGAQDDSRVRTSHATDFADALKEAGTLIQSHVLQGEHCFPKDAQLDQALQSTMDFLRNNDHPRRSRSIR